MARFRNNDQQQVASTIYHHDGIRIERVQRFDQSAFVAELVAWRSWSFRLTLGGSRSIHYAGQNYSLVPNTICWHSPLSEAVKMRWLPGTSSDKVVLSMSPSCWQTFLVKHPSFQGRHTTLLAQPNILSIRPLPPQVLHHLRQLIALAEGMSRTAPALEQQVQVILKLIADMQFQAASKPIDPDQRLRVENALTAMSNDLRKPVRIGEIAAGLNVSERQLQRDFLVCTGMTPIRYWNLLRLSEAHVLLAETALPVSEIAFTLGYVSLAHFSAAFRQLYQCSPRQVRASVLIEENRLRQTTTTVDE
jgi:AraC-like DNA-binding protein